MNIIISSESTIDVTREERSVIDRFETAMIAARSNLNTEVIEALGIIYIIMNPEIATPFPSGVIYRRSRRMIDIKSPVDFRAWKDGSSVDKLRLISQSVIDMISNTNKIKPAVAQTILELIRNVTHELIQVGA